MRASTPHRFGVPARSSWRKSQGEAVPLISPSDAAGKKWPSTKVHWLKGGLVLLCCFSSSLIKATACACRTRLGCPGVAAAPFCWEAKRHSLPATHSKPPRTWLKGRALLSVFLGFAVMLSSGLSACEMGALGSAGGGTASSSHPKGDASRAASFGPGR